VLPATFVNKSNTELMKKVWRRSETSTQCKFQWIVGITRNTFRLFNNNCIFCPLKKYKGIYINGIIMAYFMLIRKMQFLLNNRNVFRVIPTIHWNLHCVDVSDLRQTFYINSVFDLFTNFLMSIKYAIIIPLMYMPLYFFKGQELETCNESCWCSVFFNKSYVSTWHYPTFQ
jgi:hypothetical protein